MRPVLAGLAVVLAVLFWIPTAAVATSGHYLPVAGDQFAYAETITVTNGQGNYTGYSENSHYSGSMSITAVAPNETAAATYRASGTYQNSLGADYPWSESGSFTFSATSFHYVTGTDNQTGYVNPYVWFYMNNTLPRGASFALLNTEMTVVGTAVPFPMASSSTGYVATIFAEGNGSYLRSDSYGTFTATYNWKTYFDPGTGYIVGYVYTETDSNSAGDGFTYTDTLSDTGTSFALSPVAAPPAPTTPGPASLPGPLIAVGLGVVLVVAVVAILIAVRRRRARPVLPRHPTSPAPHTMPTYAPPPPLNLTPRDQPPVQQVVVREVVKVPCAYCGTLIDSTATRCPSCGAART